MTTCIVHFYAAKVQCLAFQAMPSFGWNFRRVWVHFRTDIRPQGAWGSVNFRSKILQTKRLGTSEQFSLHLKRSLELSSSFSQIQFEVWVTFKTCSSKYIFYQYKFNFLDIQSHNNFCWNSFIQCNIDDMLIYQFFKIISNDDSPSPFSIFLFGCLKRHRNF